MSSKLELGIPHYEVHKLDETTKLRDIKECFPEDKADALNWLFVGTGGFHGSTKTLNDAEDILLGVSSEKAIEGKTLITLLVVHPALCVLKWCEVFIELDDIDWLRKVCRSTYEVIGFNQKENY